MTLTGRRILRLTVLAWSAVIILVLAQSSPALALETGEQAPDFKLASTTGVDISLGDFAGKKWVLLEFYALDFSPV
jgi:hypothetical protein